MTFFNKSILVLVALASVNASAAGEVQVVCLGDGVSIAGTLSESESGDLSGSLEALGYKIPASMAGTQAYSGTRSFVKAGEFYKNFDYEVVTFMTQSSSDDLYFKSYVSLDGAVVQTLYINKVAVMVSCEFVSAK